MPASEYGPRSSARRSSATRAPPRAPRAVAGATIDDDPKLEALAVLLRETLGPEKAIVFTYYADTADWIAQALDADPARFGSRRHVVVTGTRTRTQRSGFGASTSSRPKTTLEEAGSEEVAPRTRRTCSSRPTCSPRARTSSRRATSSTTTCRGTRCGSCSATAGSTGWEPVCRAGDLPLQPVPRGRARRDPNLYDRLLRKIGHANISVGMEAPVFEDAAAVERNFAECGADRGRRGRGRRRSSSRPRRGSTPSRARSSGWTSAPRSRLSGCASCARCRTAPAAASGTRCYRREPVGVFFGARVLLGARLEPSSERRAGVALRRSRRH